LYTDGVHYFAEQARAYWFLDLVMSEWQELVQRRAFLTVNLLVSRKSAIIKVSDGNGSNVKKSPRKSDRPQMVITSFFCCWL